MDAAQADIHAYEAPWKALCDFALHSDLDKINMASNPHYGQLVSQVSKEGRKGRKTMRTGSPVSIGIAKQDNFLFSLNRYRMGLSEF